MVCVAAASCSSVSAVALAASSCALGTTTVFAYCIMPTNDLDEAVAEQYDQYPLYRPRTSSSSGTSGKVYDIDKTESLIASHSLLDSRINLVCSSNMTCLKRRMEAK